MQFHAVYEKWGLDAMVISLAFQGRLEQVTGNPSIDDAADN